MSQKGQALTFQRFDARSVVTRQKSAIARQRTWQQHIGQSKSRYTFSRPEEKEWGSRSEAGTSRGSWEHLGREEKKIAMFKCTHCGKHKTLENIRKMNCSHDYCTQCIKEIMKNAWRELRCEYVDTSTGNKCTKPLCSEVLIDVDKELFESYRKMLILFKKKLCVSKE